MQLDHFSKFPENSDPAFKQADCEQQSGPAAAAAALEGGAGMRLQKPSVAAREWGYLPCPALPSAAGLPFHPGVHTHTHTRIPQDCGFPSGLVCEAFNNRGKRQAR